MSTLSAPGKVELAGLGPVRAEAREVGHATLRRLLRLRWGVGAAVILLLIVAISVCAAWIAPHDPLAVDIRHRLVPPAWMEGGATEHLLGTDQVGRDYLARLVYGARISLSIGRSTVMVSGLIGAALGVAGGFFGGRVDDVVTFIITCRLAVPLILIALAVVSLVGSSLPVVMLTLGLLLWDRFAVVTRAAASQIRSLDYVAAARAAGCSRFYILTREVLPNIVNPLAVVATLEMALAILLEAALSFLGLGVPAPLPSWGLMIAEARDYMFFQPWVIVIPGVALLVLVLGINLLGDGLRDLLAPESRI